MKYLMNYSLLICITTAVASVQAGPITFSDDASFFAATGLLSLESFEGETATNNASQTASLALADFKLSSNATFGVFNSPAFGQAATDGSNFIASINGATTTSLLFNSALDAFAINILDFGDFGPGNLTFSNGIDSFTAAVPAPNASVQFFGIISDFAFSSVTLSHNIDGESYGLDEIYYGSVPEPGILSLFLLGVSGLLLVRRRKLVA